MKPLKPHFHEQETPESCVPACLRMVLGSFGADIPESELRALCDCTLLSGTDAMMAVEAARQLGFRSTRKYTLTIEDLQTVVGAGYFPIVFVDLGPIDNLEGVHSLVVIELGQQEVMVLDPLIGERALPIQMFETAWEVNHNLAILIEK